MKEIEKYSNPKIVLSKAIKLFGKNVKINYSTRKDKKYMIYNPNNNKWVHFGQMFYEDYTKHRDKLRRNLFRQRNHRWANSDIYTPAYLSYHLLW